jgi:hypothetical protein
MILSPFDMDVAHMSHVSRRLKIVSSLEPYGHNRKNYYALLGKKFLKTIFGVGFFNSSLTGMVHRFGKN